MISAVDRRITMLEYLCKKRHVKRTELINEFGVSKNTIDRDLIVLSCTYPIYTTQGNGGGVHVTDGYYIGREYLKSSQAELLKKLARTLEGVDKQTMRDILDNFVLNKS